MCLIFKSKPALESCESLHDPAGAGTVNNLRQEKSTTPRAVKCLTQRRRGTQRFAESSFSLRFSAFLCVSALNPVRLGLRLGRVASLPLGAFALTPHFQFKQPRASCGNHRANGADSRSDAATTCPARQ